MNTIDQAYSMGKRHMAETIWEVPSLAYFIDQRGFTCDQLKELILAIEDIKGIDYEVGFDDSDRSDELREYNEGQS